MTNREELINKILKYSTDYKYVNNIGAKGVQFNIMADEITFERSKGYNCKIRIYANKVKYSFVELVKDFHNIKFEYENKTVRIYTQDRQFNAFIGIKDEYIEEIKKEI